MEITPSLIYFISTIGTLKCICIVILIVLVILSLIIGIEILIESPNYYEDNKKIPICVGIILSIFLLLSTLLPSSKTMCAMYIIPVIANNKTIQEIPNELLDLVKLWLVELKPIKTNSP
jgi:hypothetical protein